MARSSATTSKPARANAAAAGARNVNGRSLPHFEAEGEHAAAGVTAGMSLVGLRSASFASGQGLAYMHESLYAAVGKRLTYVLNIGARAMTKATLNVHAGHDDYHCIDDTGFFQLFAKDAQSVADLNLVAHRIAELSLNPGICAQDGFQTSHVIESVDMPERDLIKEYLGDPADIIDSPTPAQRHVLGDKRRRIPEMFDVDNPTMIGTVQNQDSYAQGVASQRPFFFDHVAGLTDRAFEEFAALTGRRYARVVAAIQPQWPSGPGPARVRFWGFLAFQGADDILDVTALGDAYGTTDGDPASPHAGAAAPVFDPRRLLRWLAVPDHGAPSS